MNLILLAALALRGLDRAGGEVQVALQSGNLPEARRALSWHLVSRDTSQLDPSLVATATIESLAENASDGVIAPLLYAGLGGLPAAMAYRFSNTGDAMLGYHTPEMERLGKVPARLDDLLNWIPARLTGLLIALAAPLTADIWGLQPARQALNTMRREARRTQSPNAGFPMSAMVGGLGVTLEKVGHYRLGDQGAAPTTADIARARRVLFIQSLGFHTVAGVVHFFLLKTDARSRLPNAAALWDALRSRGLLVRNCTSFGLPDYVRVVARRPAENDRLLEAIKDIHI